MNKDTMIPAQVIYCHLIRRALEERDKKRLYIGESPDTSARIRALGAEAAFSEAARLVNTLAAATEADT